MGENDNREMNGSHIVVVDQSSEDDKLAETIRGNLEKNVFGNEQKSEGLKGDGQTAGEQTAEGQKADKQEEEFHIVNVMAEILRQRNVPATMKKLGCCTCSRCQADVIAMTLSALPSKYCVMQEHAKSPLINFYDQRYNAEISSTIMRSCLLVRDHPRHEKPKNADDENRGS
jgi:hypothetical protein